MNQEDKQNLGELIDQGAQTVRKASGEDTKVIREELALDLAHNHGISLNQVYTLAMERGICPLRYLRNMETLTVAQQLTLAGSSVAIIGLGGLGGTIAEQLARLGIGSLRMVDPDRFEETNLNRQLLSDTTGMGRAKYEVAAERVRAVNPATQTDARGVRFEESNGKELLEGVQVVLDGLDTMGDRIAVQRSCAALGIPFVHGAVAGFEGRVMTIFPGDQGLELFTDPEFRDGEAPTPEAELGVPAPTPLAVAAFQVTETLKLLLNRGQPIRNAMLIIDLEVGTVERIELG